MFRQIFTTHKDGLILGGLLLIWAIVYFYQRAIKKAPMGYEDENGFHSSEDETEKHLLRIAGLEYANEFLKSELEKIRAERTKAEHTIIDLKNRLKNVKQFLDKPTEQTKQAQKLDALVERKVKNGL